MFEYKDRISYKGRLLEAADSADWSCYCDEDGIDFRKHSPAGEDFGFYIRAKTGEEILEKVREYAEGFDTEEHIAMWVEVKQDKVRNDIPSIRELVEDADDIQKMLDNLVDILEEVPETIPAVLIELDYKGYYGRYALTPEEFEKEFKERLESGMPEATEEDNSYTLRPMVHIWYTLDEVGGDFWNTFFTDLSWGLPESDIEAENFAYIRTDEMKSLRTYLPQCVDENEASN